MIGSLYFDPHDYCLYRVISPSEIVYIYDKVTRRCMVTTISDLEEYMVKL